MIEMFYFRCQCRALFKINFAMGVGNEPVKCPKCNYTETGLVVPLIGALMPPAPDIETKLVPLL